jgi:two-component system NtrC family sensor kinase
MKEDSINRKFNDTEERLRLLQPIIAVGQLTAGIAHEINTPIQYVRDNTLFLKDEFDNISTLITLFQRYFYTIEADDKSILEQNIKARITDLDYLLKEIPQAIDQTLHGSEAIAKMVRSIKRFAHPGREERSSTNLHELIESAIMVCRNEWKYVATVSLEFDPQIQDISCYPSELGQVIINLVVNAGHALCERSDKSELGQIIISTKKLVRDVEIIIADNGPGIPLEIQNLIFESFFTTKAIGKGTGQGLAIVKNTIEQLHSGTIILNSTPGIGASFIICLPLVEEDK